MLRAALCMAILATACAQSAAPVAPPAVAQEEGPAQDRPLVVILHAEWCAACHRAVPAMKWLREEYGERVTFVELDVTNDATIAESATKASRVGLRAYFDQSHAPGIAILGKDRRPVRRFASEFRGGPYQAAVEEALLSFAPRSR